MIALLATAASIGPRSSSPSSWASAVRGWENGQARVRREPTISATSSALLKAGDTDSSLMSVSLESGWAVKPSPSSHPFEAATAPVGFQVRRHARPWPRKAAQRRQTRDRELPCEYPRRQKRASAQVSPPGAEGGHRLPTP